MLHVATKFAPTLNGFEQAYQAGFRAVELWLNDKILADAESWAALASGYPFRYAMHFPNRTDLAEPLVEEVARLYGLLNCRCLVIHEPMYRRFASRLRELRPDIRLAVENHHIRPDEFDDWCGRQSGIALDVEHLWMLTMGNVTLEDVLAEVRQFLRRHGERLEHVHLPGYTPGYEEHRPMYCNRDLVLGVFDALAERNFDGLIVSEISLPFQAPQDLRMDVLLFESWRTRRLNECPSAGDATA